MCHFQPTVFTVLDGSFVQTAFFNKRCDFVCRPAGCHLTLKVFLYNPSLPPLCRLQLTLNSSTNQQRQNKTPRPFPSDGAPISQSRLSMGVTSTTRSHALSVFIHICLIDRCFHQSFPRVAVCQPVITRLQGKKAGSAPLTSSSSVVVPDSTSGCIVLWKPQRE